jgi:multicomponent Na+:H+ antiporter subunit G
MFFLGWSLITIGLLFIFCGMVAIFRFPDFYTKLHAASVIECFAVPLCFIGLALLQDDINSSIKLVFISVLVFILNPVSTHALGRASLLYKIDKDGRIK